MTKQYSDQAEALYQDILDRGQTKEHDEIYRFKSALQAARTYYWDGKGEEGIPILKNLSAEIDVYLQNHPQSLEAKRAFAAIHSETGLSISSHYSVAGGDVREALPYIDKAIGIQIEMGAADPDDFKVRRNVVGTYYKRALIYSGLEDSEKMLEDLNLADINATELLDKDPDDSGMKRIALAVRELKSRTLSQLGRHEEALAMGRESYRNIKQLFDNEPDSPGRAREFANSQANLAKSLNSAGQRDAACKLYRETVETWRMIEDRWEVTEFDKQDAVTKAEEFVASCN